MAEIPGITAKHAFVTDTCRRNHTDAGAVDEALARLRDEAMAILGGWPEGRGAKLHFALTMERPDVRTRDVAMPSKAELGAGCTCRPSGMFDGHGNDFVVTRVPDCPVHAACIDGPTTTRSQEPATVLRHDDAGVVFDCPGCDGATTKLVAHCNSCGWYTDDLMLDAPITEEGQRFLNAMAQPDAPYLATSVTDAAAPSQEQGAEPCTWRGDGEGNFDTTCGGLFILLDGDPSDNRMGFCCYCGKPLAVVPETDEVDDDD